MNNSPVALNFFSKEELEQHNMAKGVSSCVGGSRRRDKRNKTQGGKRRKTEGGKRKKTEGGKRKTRKMSKGASDWTQKVVKLYKEMKSKDDSVRFGDALKRASKLKKEGKL